MVLLNFALEAVGTKVSCNKIHTDGYECTNLINPNFIYRNKGFLAEHFIKPPVDVTFSFPCNVNIYCILLNPFVGQQSSSQLEVFCASKPLPKTKHGQRLAEERKQSSSYSEQSPLFYQVSKIMTPHQTRIGFHNSRFPSHLSCEYSSMMSSLERKDTAEMRHSRAELLVSATDLTIRISRVKNGSTPAISNVEIWGCVSSQVNDNLRKSIHDKYNSVINPIVHKHPPEDETRSITNNKTEEMKSQSGDDIHIPEEFIDPLTCEIMAIPMLLPSGKNVDKLTLDRYFDSEASHGRQPRDPFTGVEFHGDVKPVPNGTLKARIDQFLSKNSHDPSVASLPRTVSSGNQCGFQRKRKSDSALQVSSLVKKSRNVTQTQVTTDHACTSSSSYKSSSSLDKSNDLSSGVSYFSETIDNTNKGTCEGRTHESCLKDSLDNALSALLGSSSSVVTVEKDTLKDSSAEPSVIICSKCRVHLQEDSVCYTIPCSHFLCRSCLLSYDTSENSIQCFTCHKNCFRSEVMRTHSSVNK